MINYYHILGLTAEAGIAEIKSAFRALAKLYHPDINPLGKEQFGKILKAYETLSDERLKAAYDRKLSHSLSNPIEQKSGNKNWRFDERELKRRQYYNDHIKPFEKKNDKKSTQSKSKASYNEYKYILFATPLAVILFLFIMSVSSNRNVSLTPKIENQVAGDSKTITSDLKMGDAPYYDYFGKPHYVLTDGVSLRIKNLSGFDIIVCLFKKNVIVRSFFIANKFAAEVPQLPNEALLIRYSAGVYFDKSNKTSNGLLAGGFREDKKFYKSVEPIFFNSINELTLMTGVNEGFVEIDELEFFKK